MEYRAAQGITGPLFIGRDTHGLSKPAEDSALEVLQANGVTAWTDSRDSWTPTPAVSHAILAYNKAGHDDQADGIVVTPSHNPPRDGGFKYNPPNGGPADTDATGWIANKANAYLEAGLSGVQRVPFARARAAVAAIPRAALQMDDAECRHLTQAICGAAEGAIGALPGTNRAAPGTVIAPAAAPAAAFPAAAAPAPAALDPAAPLAPAPAGPVPASAAPLGDALLSTDATNAAPLGPAGTAAGRVLIVIPNLNEAAHIADVLDAILPFAGRVDARIVVVDGGSADATAVIVREHALRHPRIDLLDNPARLQAAAVNRAARAYGDGCEWLLRLDAHSAYPPDYGDALLAEAAETGADSVVVSMEARGEQGLQRLIAEAQNSRIGNGGSAHRLAGRGAWVDHGHHALMRMAAFRAVGGYDERFSHNEDAELDHRLRAAGYRIRLTGRTALGYFPRKRLAPLMRQYFNFGRGRARNLAKHGTRPALRQAAVAMLAPALLLTLLVPLSPVFALPLAVWLLACLAGGLMIAWSTRNPAGVLSGFIAGLMHLAWSAGYWRERLAPPPEIGKRAT